MINASGIIVALPGKSFSHRVCVLMAMCVVLQSAFCHGATLSFREFQEINQENYNQILAGRLQIQYSSYKRLRPEDLNRKVAQEKERYERRMKEIDALGDISDERRASRIKQLESTLIHQKRLKSGKLDTQFDSVRTYTFDLKNFQYRLDEHITKPNESNVKSSTILLSEGKHLQYFTDYDYGIAKYFKGVVARDLPAHFGTVTPEVLYGINENDIITTTEMLDGHEVDVYDISQADGSRMRLYIDPAVGCRYRKVEFFRGGKLTQTCVAKEYGFFDGVALPTFHELEVLGDDTSDKPLRSQTMRIETAQLNRPIQPQAFTMTYSPKTRILDLNLKMVYKPFLDMDREDIIPVSLEELIETGIEQKAKSVIEHEVMDIPETLTAKIITADDVTDRQNEGGRPLEISDSNQSSPTAQPIAEVVTTGRGAFWFGMFVIISLLVAVGVFVFVITAKKKKSIPPTE